MSASRSWFGEVGLWLTISVSPIWIEGDGEAGVLRRDAELPGSKRYICMGIMKGIAVKQWCH